MIRTIGAKTKIHDLLSNYPFIKDFLKELNPHFKALDNPVMRNTLGRVATLQKAAMVGGMEVGELLEKVAMEINSRPGPDVEIEGAAGDGKASAVREERVLALKAIIEDLHRGEDVTVLKKRFLELIRDVAPSEIAEMEQRLIDGGMPEEEVKKLCDVHVEVFRESLETKAVPGLPAGHPVHTYMLENRELEKIILRLQAVHNIQNELDTLVKEMENLQKLDIHYARKENQLFPVLEAHGVSGPSKVMWALHDEIRKTLKEALGKARDGAISAEEIGGIIKTLNDMIFKEEHILYPMALETLGDSDWVKVRTGEEEIGYAWIEPPERWTPSGDGWQQNLPPEKIGSVTLDTGLLSVEQLNLVLTHLPVDISFVDENDRVAYYSNTPERIFPRSPGIIGRSVQNCHPSKSVETVNKILESFKSGTKDTAEFWIELGGSFIHIRYFAVRDHNGAYRGCLEVSQDITAIRKIEGQRRLLDWD